MDYKTEPQSRLFPMLFSYSLPYQLSPAQADQLEPLALKKHPGPSSHPSAPSQPAKKLELGLGAGGEKQQPNFWRFRLGFDQEVSEGGCAERLRSTAATDPAARSCGQT